MIDLYYWPTPNGWKITIMLEECGLDYRVIPVDIRKGDQFKPEFLAISPNNRMPAIIDTRNPDDPVHALRIRRDPDASGGEHRQLHADRHKARNEMLEWLFWQVGSLGPMAGQLSHFVNYAPGERPTRQGALCATNTTAASAC